tara:strand:- start:2889 stop:5060 length:2172 start_codon:yes stop_codon:yes gene_type:complete
MINFNKNLTWFKVILNCFIIYFLIFVVSLIYIFYLSKDLPSLDELQKFNPQQVSKIISADGVVVKKLYTHKRDMVNISHIPVHLRNALFAMEDRDFYSHSGISIKGTIRAIIVDVLTLSTRQGASTITQQLARNMYNSIGFKKTITRKIKELITAIKIEQTYTKTEILELYLNSIYFGHGNYGVQSASIYYFNKNVKELTLDESAILIGLLPAPARYSPISHPTRSIKRRNLVLNIMNSEGYISEKELNINLDKKLNVSKGDFNKSIAPHYTEYVRRELEKIDTELGFNIYEDGLEINTSIDSRIQSILNDVFIEVMEKNQKSFNKELLGNTKLLKKISKQNNFNLDTLKYILKNNLEIPKILRNQLLVQGAAVVIDPKHGGVLGMVGGRIDKTYLDHFNRTEQAKRQPGSVFKPFIYLSALENGYSPCTQLINQPLVFFIDDTTRWNPQNHDGSTGLQTSLRTGLQKSLNLISVRVVQELIDPIKVKNTADRFNFRTRIRPVDAIALGVSEVIPLDITLAYSALAYDGILHEPLILNSIKDREGNLVQNFIPKSKEVADEKTVYILRDMMKSVVDKGTGGSLRWKYKFYSPAAGKTGTTNNKTDAWFIGFTPEIAIGVWVGIDNPEMKLGDKQYGSKAALPIFAKTINKIYSQGDYYYLNNAIPLNSRADWDIPEGVVKKSICEDTCCLQTEWCESYDEYFMENNSPNSQCEQYSNPLLRFK